MTNYDTVVAVGYHDSLKWAVYDPTDGKVGHGDLGKAPEYDFLNNGYGARITPFYPATDDDLTYCVALSDWWRGVAEKRHAALGTIHQIGDDNSTVSSRASRRKHQLISETKLDEYFDCTVRVSVVLAACFTRNVTFTGTPRAPQRADPPALRD
jgi:hypothetical protein